MEGSGQLVGSVARGAVDSSAKQRAGHVRGAGVYRGGVLGWGAVGVWCVRGYVLYIKLGKAGRRAVALHVVQ